MFYRRHSHAVAIAGRERLLPFLRLTRREFLKGTGFACLAAPSILTAAAADKQFRPLFDGKTIAGWHNAKPGQTHGTGARCTASEGALQAEQEPPGSGNGGILLSDLKFGDFELRFEFKPDWGVDSGVFFRCTENGHGFQFYIDYHDGGNVGHLRGEMPGAFAMKPFQIFSTSPGAPAPQGFRTKTDPRAEKWPEGVYEQSCKPEEWIHAWKTHDWNAAKIICQGKYPVITSWINDLQVCKWDGARSAMSGYDREKVFAQLGGTGALGLQVHRGKRYWPQGAKCRWRNIEIREI